MSTISEWLASLGLSEYAERFAENHIDLSVLRDLTDQDLKELGVVLGDRRKVLRAIGELAGVVPAVPGPQTRAGPRGPGAAARPPRTVMLCDLVGSTALSARLDPEDQRGVIGAYHRCCAEIVERNDGFVAKYMGDGVLAYFGYPQAHEHDAERAVRAGLALVEGVPKLTTAAGVPLQVRVGIATGLVVVGDLIGAGAAQEQAVVGEAPNLAARLQTVAEPGTVVISSSTRRLTGGLYDYRDLGELALKGFAVNVPAWQVLGASAAESRFEALRASSTPLVGRGEEIDLLLRRWERAKDGEGSVVLLSGEPGIGKSRITETILERLGDEPHTRVRCFCSPHHQDSAFYPSIAQLERAVGFRREDTVDQRLDKLEQVVALAANDVGEAVSLLADLLSVPTGDRYPALDLTPQKRKEKTLRALVAQVEGLAAHHPVLLLFEDVHWSDPTTRELLDLLIDRVPNLGVLLIITFRPEFTPQWVGRPHVTLLSLSRLTPRLGDEMITHVTGGKALPREIADQIIDRTDGVPLFIEELTKAVLESGVLTDAGDRYAVAGQPPLVAIPASLNASLLERLDRLAPVREVAQIAAALGRQFSHELISAVAAIPRQQLDDALEQLVKAEMIFRRGSPPDAEYIFKHALVQDAAYGTLLRSRRQLLHARITAALEGQFPEIVEMQPELLARHCTEAGLADKALGHWLKAAQQSSARWALTEAVAQLRKGLEILSVLPDDAARLERELDLQITLGQVFIVAKGYAAPEPAEAYARARQLCERLNRPRQLIAVLDGQMSLAMFRGDVESCRRIGEEQLRLGEARQDPVWIVLGCVDRGVPCLMLGEFMAARQHFERGLGLYDPDERAVYAALAAEDPQVILLTGLSWSLFHLGHLEQARLRVDAAQAEARRLAHPITLGWASYCMMTMQLAVGAYDVGLEESENLLGLVEKYGLSQFWPAASMARGRCLVAHGQHRAGIELLESGVAVYRASGARSMLPAYLAWLAEALLDAGQPKQGLERIAESADEVEATGERTTESWMHCVHGKLLLAVNDTKAADESFRQALAIARRQNARLWELFAATNLARLWRDQGNEGEARELLAPVYDWFTDGFDTPVLRDAKALLEQFAV